MQIDRSKLLHGVLHVILTAAVVGVLLGMAVTGAVFLISGPPPGHSDEEAGAGLAPASQPTQREPPAKR